MRIGRIVASAMATLIMAGTVVTLAPSVASGAASGIKWYKVTNFPTQAECVAEKNRYVIDYGLVVMPTGDYCFSGSGWGNYFEYMQEF